MTTAQRACAITLRSTQREHLERVRADAEAALGDARSDKRESERDRAAADAVEAMRRLFPGAHSSCADENSDLVISYLSDDSPVTSIWGSQQGRNMHASLQGCGTGCCGKMCHVAMWHALGWFAATAAACYEEWLCCTRYTLVTNLQVLPVLAGVRIRSPRAVLLHACA
jgi:hypothetical protein